MNKSYTILHLLIVATLSFNLQAREIKVASLNLQWFGIGGEHSGLESDEYRHQWVSEFLATEYAGGDVITFQEVINFKLLKKMMKPLKHQCISYEKKFINHQKVAICFNKNKYKAIASPRYPDYIIDELSYVGSKKGYLRPAVYIKLIDKKTNENIANIIALHLKASPNKRSALIRVDQIRALSKALSGESGHHIILGDFNSHTKEKTSFQKDDIDFYNEILKDNAIKKVDDFNKVTYRVKGRSLHLDHIYISSNISATPIKVNDACKHYGSHLKRFSNFVFYNRFISDHCLIQTKLRLK